MIFELEFEAKSTSSVSCERHFFAGSILTSLAVTQEEDTNSGLNNDDRILACCLNLDTAPAPVIKDGMKTVQRTAVLLTDDR